MAPGTVRVAGQIEQAGGGARNARLVERLEVRLWPAVPGEGYERLQSAFPQSDGSFVFPSVAPGRYLAVCMPSDAVFSPYRPEARQRYAGQIQEIEVKAGEAMSLKLEAIEAL